MARTYGGRRSASSGAADNDQGDVRTPTLLIEAKVTGGPGQIKPLPKFVREFEKITEEAWSEGREPVLALRYFAPDSILSDTRGWIDLAVRRVIDDAYEATE